MADKPYTVLATGLYVQEETDWDQATPHDEYYALVTIMASTSDNKWSQKTVRIPGAASAFTDMDTGEFKMFNVICWDGPLNRFGLGCQVVEEDAGNSEVARQLLEAAAQAAVKAGQGYTGMQVPEEFADAGVTALESLLDLQDDPIDSFQSRHFSSAKVPKLASSKRFKSKQGIPYRFRTVHQGGGASIWMYYDFFPS